MRPIRFGRYIGDEVKDRVSGNYVPNFVEPLKHEKECYRKLKKRHKYLSNLRKKLFKFWNIK